MFLARSPTDFLKPMLYVPFSSIHFHAIHSAGGQYGLEFKNLYDSPQPIAQKDETFANPNQKLGLTQQSLVKL